MTIVTTPGNMSVSDKYFITENDTIQLCSALEIIANTESFKESLEELIRYAPNKKAVYLYLTNPSRENKEKLTQYIRSHGNSIHPMGWGRFSLLTPTPKHALVCYNVGIAPHIHKETDAIVRPIIGSGTYTLGSKGYEYSPNMRINIPKGTRHGFYAKEFSVILSQEEGNIIRNRDNHKKTIGDTEFTNSEDKKAYESALENEIS